MVDRIAGYHFEMQFGVMFTALESLVVERAGVARIKASGYELRPRASMLRAIGTCLHTGDLHFQVLEHRMDLDAWLIQEPRATSRQGLFSFGVSHEPEHWILPHVNKAVGLWLRNGALVFRAFQSERCSFDEAVLADFDMWQALDALVGLASGEPSFGAPLPQAAQVQAGRALPYAAPTWARDFEVTARGEPGKAYASFNSPRYFVGGSVTFMERGAGG